MNVANVSTDYLTKYLRFELDGEFNGEDDVCWLIWSPNRYGDLDLEGDLKIVNRKILLQRISG